MEHGPIRIDRDAGVVTVPLDRPGTRNACSMEMGLGIRDIFRELAHPPEARAIVLTGAGGDFCSGADVVKKRDDDFDGSHLGAMRQLADSVMAVHDCPVPVIVQVDGVAVGAGFGLALAGDMLFCSERARFSAVFARLGLSLDYGSSWLLARRVGLHKAKELAFTAEMMSGVRAGELGFVNAVLPVDALDAEVARVAARVAQGPPVALSMIKRMLDNAATSSLIHALETEAIAQTVNLGTEDLVEAFQAFRQKREPRFFGR